MDHYCETCGRTPAQHDLPDFAEFFDVQMWYLPPCCKGCCCQTYQEELRLLEEQTGKKYVSEEEMDAVADS